MFDFDGNKVGDEFAISPSPDTGQNSPHLIALDNGGLAFGWVSDAVYAGTRHGQVLKVNLRDAEQNRSVELERFDPVTAVAVSEDGKELLVGTARGKVRRFAAGLDREPREERSGGEAVTALQVLPGRKYLVGSRGALFMAVTDGWAVPTRGPVDWVLPFAHGFAAPAAPGRVLLRTDRWQELATGDEGPPADASPALLAAIAQVGERSSELWLHLLGLAPLEAEVAPRDGVLLVAADRDDAVLLIVDRQHHGPGPACGVQDR